MNFQSPASLFWLIPLLGTIIVLYLLRMRRRDVRVPAVFLWPKLTADVRANAPFQKLRFSWLLVIQLLVVALIVTALADPLKRARGLRGKATVIVLDASASMGSTDVKPTRFDNIRDRARELIGTMGSDDRCALIEAGALTRVVAPLTGDRARLEQALRETRVTDSANDMGEALRLASAIAGAQSGGRIIVYSDGSFPPVTDFSPGKSEVAFESVGSSGNNVAITALDVGSAPNGRKQLFTGIRNLSTDALKVTYTAVADGQVIDAKSVNISGGQTIGEADLLPTGTAKAEARIDSQGDLLAADNHASIYVQGAGTVRVLLVTSGDLFLERALALQPNLRVDKAPEVPQSDRAGTPSSGDYDLVVFDGTTPVPVKAPSEVCFGQPAAEFDVGDAGPDTAPRVVTWKRDDPILNHVDLTDTLIQKAHRVTVLPGGRPLVTGPSGPLIVWLPQSSGKRRLYVAFNLLDSDLPLRVAFPIFMDNLVAWLTSTPATGRGGITARAGQPFEVGVPSADRSVTLIAPDGVRSELDSSSGMATVRTAVRAGGDYTLKRNRDKSADYRKTFLTKPRVMSARWPCSTCQAKKLPRLAPPLSSPKSGDRWSC